jgi:hypothetical protein
MDLQTRKIEFIQEFLKIQKEEAVIRFEKLLEKEKSKMKSDDLKPFSIEEFNKRIDSSISDSILNRITNNSDLLNEIQTWK